MRTRRNETLTRQQDVEAEAADGIEGPIRRCILSGERTSRAALIRLALGPDGAIHPDVRAKAPGRGAWIGVTRSELDEAQARGRLRGALARGFKTNDFRIEPDLGARIEEALSRAALDRLGLESRAGTLLAGAERIDTAARSGKVAALYHAADAGDDGRRRLDQAWRVGSEMEGSARRGVELPFTRTILSLALGRENVVHLAATDARARDRIDDAVARLAHFMGTHDPASPCEMDSQGTSAATIPVAVDDD